MHQFTSMFSSASSQQLCLMWKPIFWLPKDQKWSKNTQNFSFCNLGKNDIFSSPRISKKNSNFGLLLGKIGVQSHERKFDLNGTIFSIFAYCAENKRVKIVIEIEYQSWFFSGFLSLLFFQIAFHELNPFPMRTITHKREHHYKLLEVKLKHFFLTFFLLFSRWWSLLQPLPRSRLQGVLKGFG